VRWKTFISFCSKFIQEMVYQISSVLLEFYRRHYKKAFWSFFSGYSDKSLFAIGATTQTQTHTHMLRDSQTEINRFKK